MSEPIVYIDHSEVREGRLDELKVAMNDLAQLIEANEPRLIAYEVYLNDDATRVTVIHVHHDAASLELHMKVAGPAFSKFTEFVRLLAIDVYGKLGDELVEQLRDKARLLGNGTVAMHERHAGFARMTDPSDSH